MLHTREQISRNIPRTPTLPGNVLEVWDPRDAQRVAPSSEVAPDRSSLDPWLRREVALLPSRQKASGEERQVAVK